MLFKVFESGKYPQGDFPPPTVEALALDYDPDGDIEAPCVVGHLDNTLAERIENELADGWIKSLQYRQLGGELWADCELSENLKGLIAAKRIRYVSAEIAKREAGLYLVRLAFLGRSIPAVSTARIPAAFRWIGTKFGLHFEEPDNNLLRFCRRLEASPLAPLLKEGGTTKDEESDPQIAQMGADLGNHERHEKHERIMEEDDMAKIPEEQFAQKLAEEQKRTAQFAADAERYKVDAEKAAAELAQFCQKQEKAEVEARLAVLRDGGKLPPAEFEQAVGLALLLRGEHRELYFKQLESRPPLVDTSGKQFATAELAAEPPAGQSATEQIRQFAAQHKISFEEAAERLYKAKPDLFASEE